MGERGGRGGDDNQKLETIMKDGRVESMHECETNCISKWVGGY